MASEVAFLVGETVVDLDGSRLVFRRGRGGFAPALYADLGRSVYRASGGQQMVVETAAEIPGVLGKTVSRTSTDGGVLVLGFHNGSEVRCAPSEAVEAWEVIGRDQQAMVFCLPGGELQVFEAKTPRTSLGDFIAESTADAARLRDVLAPRASDEPDAATPNE